MLRSRDRVATGGVHDHHAVLGSSRDVDVVHSDAGTTDDIQLGGGFNDLRGHFHAAAHDDCVHVLGRFAELGLLQTELHFDFEGGLGLEKINAGLRNGVSDENFLFGHRDAQPSTVRPPLKR